MTTTYITNGDAGRILGWFYLADPREPEFIIFFRRVVGIQEASADGGLSTREIIAARRELYDREPPRFENSETSKCQYRPIR